MMNIMVIYLSKRKKKKGLEAGVLNYIWNVQKDIGKALVTQIRKLRRVTKTY